MDMHQRALSAFTDMSYLNVAAAPSPFPPLEKHPFALEKRRVMHPFLGEMGLEIRGFLGQIEPWLRAGWVIPARRTSFYPTGSAFEDPVYFERVQAIKAAYGLREMVGRLETTNPTQISVATGGDEERSHIMISCDTASGIRPALAARRDLRRAFFDRYGHDELLPTRWHGKLSSQSYLDDEFEETARWAVPPSYLPAFFEAPPFEFPQHIGVQLRNVPQNPARNSDPERMARLATEAAAILKLPVLVYGKGDDLSLPDIPRTIDLLPPGTPQMSAELAMLKNCALMIAPDSGWADLMGWLRVPTLLERVYFPWAFAGLRPFSPRIVLANDADLRASIEAVLAADVPSVLPDARTGEHPSDFLEPTGTACRIFWRDFLGRD